MAQCGTCKGQRKVIARVAVGTVTINGAVDCPECKGTGETGNPDVCQRCNGSTRDTVNVTVGDKTIIKVEVDCPDCCPALEELK